VKPGDNVVWHTKCRGRGHVGGWKPLHIRATVVKVARVNAWIKYGMRISPPQKVRLSELEKVS